MLTTEQILEQHRDQRTPCEVWTRVMGYHRPTTAFNPGKLQEHKDRKHFTEGCLSCEGDWR